MKDKIVLILGAGQIGEECAIRLLKWNPSKIILHSLTKEEAELACNNAGRMLKKGYKTELVPSWGNVLVPKELMFLSREKLHKSKANRKVLLNYYYGYLSNRLIKRSALYNLIEKWNPDYIFDGINTATVVGYQDDPYSLPREVLQKNLGSKNIPEQLLVSNIVPALIRFTQALKQSLLDFNVVSYVKISTTGLGGMGDNLMYTHGDVNEPGMSSGILGKVAASGVLHQLLWSLSHTPKVNVKVVVPAALVGWQGVNFGGYRSHGENIPLVDNRNVVNLNEKPRLKPQLCEKLKSVMEIPYVDSGENCAYSLGEMTAITALGQMECVTREEIAQAAIELAMGSTKHDLLTAMDLVSMGPSHVAAVQRTVVLSRLKELEVASGVPSIATNNLGPTVSKHLFELHLLMECSNKSVKACAEMNTKLLVKKLENFIFENKDIRSQIVSLGLPIIFEGEKVIFGEHFQVPNLKDKLVINPKNVNDWADSGWIDLRRKHIKFWQKTLAKILIDTNRCRSMQQVVLDRNWQNVNSGNIGELLGYAYSIMGGERKTEFVYERN